jgi:uncharacterized protein YgbK (DUF1537 family)
LLLGAIADDLTGATDLALSLKREGMRTIQVVGVPQTDFAFGDADAVVVALKSRTIETHEAVAMSVASARVLLHAGAEQLFFKYCSTFDSTPAGNIGPVTEALLGLLDTDFTIVCPAFPTNGRTVYRGHLFVGPSLLSESSMRDHPLTPMTDANLVRVLQVQTTAKVGLVGYEDVDSGHDRIEQAFASARRDGMRMVIVDAVTNRHLRAIGQAAAGLKLVTGGSGVAIGLPENFRRAGKLAAAESRRFEVPAGSAVILAGSCSTATRRQIDVAIQAGVPTFKIDPFDIEDGRTTVEGVCDWATSAGGSAPPLVYSSTDPAEVQRAQAAFGREQAGEMVEQLLAAVARLLHARGFSRFLVAGGETSGAVVNGLGVEAMLIGPEIDPGVPWTSSVGLESPVALALKSGNFGADDFFLKAWRLLP